MKRKFRIVALSDLHIGSLLSPWPTGYITDPDVGSGVRHQWPNLNSTMRIIGAFQNEAIPKAVKGADIVLWAGDVCDGVQKASYGKYTVTNDLNYQEEAAIFSIERWIPDPPPMFFVTGTPYHSEQQRPMERAIAKHFSGEVGMDLLIEECDINIYMNHFVPTTRSVLMYRPTPVARDLMLLALHNAPEEYGHVDLMIRGHAHYKCEVKLGSQTGIILPCWQARTPYAIGHGLISPPDIGYTIIEVERPDFGLPRPTITTKFVTKRIVPPTRSVGSQSTREDIGEQWETKLDVVKIPPL